jgi:hypothetical protein
LGLLGELLPHARTFGAGTDRGLVGVVLPLSSFADVNVVDVIFAAP